MISAVVHTYNEGKNIDRCLSSLSSFSDEIVLVDMGSSDDTCRKAKLFKAEIFTYPYTGFVEPARNFGIEKAKGDWIFILDADEELSYNLSKRLKDIIDHDLADFCRIPRKNIIWGKWIKHAGWWPDYQIRFFKKGSVNWPDKIHSIPFTRGIGFDLEANEENSIIHYNYQFIDQFILRLNRYTSISAKELYLNDKHFDPKSLIENPVEEFNTRFFAKEGYKDGIHGLALSLLQGAYAAIVELKLWELESFKEHKLHLDHLEKYFDYEYRQKKFWIYSELLKKPHNLYEEVLWRIKRKLASL